MFGTKLFATKPRSPLAQTLFVAASDAPALVKMLADYACDGTADQVEINAALAALPSTGGVVRLSEGTFNIASSVLIQQDSATLVGAGLGSRSGGTQVGRSTFLKAAAGLTSAVVMVKRVADDRPVYGVTIRDLTVDGNSIGSGVDGIYFSSNEGLVENVYCHTCTGDGMQVQGYVAWTTYNTRIINFNANHNTLNGLNLNTYAGDVHVMFPVIYTNTANGIRINGAGNQITGGQLYDNDRGIYLDNGGAQTQIALMKIENSAKEGIYFDATTVGPSQVRIVGCAFRLNCRSADNTYDVIGGTGSGSACTGVLIEGCGFNSNVGTDPDLPRYGVNLWNATACQQWHVIGNQFARNPNHWATAPINVTGTPVGTKVRNNNGAPDWGYNGTAAITAAATAVTVTHNLPYTPAVTDITVTPTNNPTNDPGNFWIDTITATQFNINVRAVPGASTATFAWRAN